MKCITLLLLTALACEFARGADEGQFVDLGVQVRSFTLQGTTFAKLPDGRDVVCSVVRGAPAKLIVYDVRTGQMLHRMPLGDANGGWNATTATDGTVYVGTDNNGHLYRWLPGEPDVRDLGSVLADQSFCWDVAPGRDGEVFIGTYPGCNVVRYHPDDGFSDAGRGAVTPGENYVRSVTYDASTDKVYAGVGSHAHLVEINPRTGDKKQILPAKYADQEFAYTVDIVAEKLFVQLSLGQQSIVMDPATREVQALLPKVGLQVVSPKAPDEQAVYYSGDGGLCRYDLATRTASKVEAVGKLVIIGMTWLSMNEGDFKGQTLVMMSPRGQITWYHPASGKVRQIQASGEAEEVPIQSIVRGPDGRIYSGGYLVGGLSAYDPSTGKHQQYNPMGQPEGMVSFKSKLFLGVYPRARLYVFDTARPWDPSQENPHLIDTLGRLQQDRPFAVLPVESLNRVYFGTVPDYGKHGGVLASVDADSYAVEVHADVVKNQSIVSLAWDNELIVGGTGIAGGLGAEPIAKEAKLFLWDPASKQKVYETVPVEGAGLVTGLMIGPDRNIWGIADGQLFIFDVAAHKVIARHRLFPVAAGMKSGWRDAYLKIHPNGLVYGTSRGRLFSIDPKTMAVTVLRDKGCLFLAIDDAGRVYFADRARLIQYTPPN